MSDIELEFKRYIGRIALTSESLNYLVGDFNDSELKECLFTFEKIKLCCFILNSCLGVFEDVRKEK